MNCSFHYPKITHKDRKSQLQLPTTRQKIYSREWWFLIIPHPLTPPIFTHTNKHKQTHTHAHIQKYTELCQETQNNKQTQILSVFCDEEGTPVASKKRENRRVPLRASDLNHSSGDGHRAWDQHQTVKVSGWAQHCAVLQ